MGTAFMMHGWMKIQTPFGWVPPQAPMHIPPFFQFLAAISEFGGGIALILGIIIPLASFGLICTMVVAVYTNIAVFNAPFVNNTGGQSYEIALLYLCLAILFFVTGPGIFSLDRLIFGGHKRSTESNN
jgi:putative oxidoreductase